MGLLFILISFFETTAQEAQITYSASEKPLDKVLEELSQRYRFRFAYDAARFSQFKVSFTVRNSTWGELTDILKHKYPLRFKYLEGTWIVTLHPEAKKPPESKPSVAQKKSYCGYVTDHQTGEPLAYCNVVFPDLTGTITNASGYFYHESDAPAL